jgi:folate-binding protein YgfZ
MSVTALHEKLAAAGATFGSYRGADTALSFGNTATEFQAMLVTCGIFDVSWQVKLVLSGEDRVRWLNGMVTNNIRDLAPNHGNCSFLLNAQGRIQGDLAAYNRGEYLLVTTDLEQRSKITAIFDQYIIMDDVEVSDISDKLATVGLIGPEAVELLQSAGVAISTLEPGQVVDTVWRDLGISIARNLQPHIEGYEIWFAAENFDKIWDILVFTGAKPVGAEALERYRIARGVPRPGVDLRDRDLPQETGQAHVLNFTKGCYIGQEIVERIRSRGNVHRAFTGFALQGEPPQPGSKIREGGRDVGEMTSATRVPFPSGERILALGYLRRELAEPGTAVEIDGQPATVESLPFRH